MTPIHCGGFVMLSRFVLSFAEQGYTLSCITYDIESNYREKELHGKSIFSQLNDIIDENTLDHIIFYLRSDHLLYRDRAAHLYIKILTIKQSCNESC